MLILLTTIKLWFLRLFKKRQGTLDNEEIEIEGSFKKQASVRFDLCPNGEVNVAFFWPDFLPHNDGVIKEVARNYASLLDAVSGGTLKKKVIGVLYDISINSKIQEDKKFIEYILTFFLDSENKKKLLEDQKDHPLQRPTEVFNKYK